MTEQEKNISRRKFLQRSAASVAAASSLQALSAYAKETAHPLCDSMPMRTLGKTGLKVSTLSFGGGSKFLKCKNWEALLERSVELGVNFFDTASEYGGAGYETSDAAGSEERFGRILPKYRDKVIICTKFSSRDVNEAMKEFEESLKLMKTDYVDVLMLHSLDASDNLVAFEKGTYKMMLKQKEQGTAKFIGFSSMDSAPKSRLAMRRLDIDIAILGMNPTQYGDYVKVALPAARERNVGVVAMKVLRWLVGIDLGAKKLKEHNSFRKGRTSGTVTAKELVYYDLAQEGVASCVIGHEKISELEENVQLAKQFEADRKAKKVAVDYKELEERLACCAGPHVLGWARPDYYDGMDC
jgi:aryl-alcohol dehydrogenase-like predicted oxidoreductase